MDSRELTTSMSSTRNSSKQAMPLSLNMTGSFFGKKFPGHSRQPGQDKDLNDQTAASRPLARTPLPPTTLPYHLSSLLKISSPSTVDSSLRTMVAHISDPLTHPISTSDLNTSPELRALHSIKHMLHLRDGVLTYVPEPFTAPKLIVPHGQRGMMLTHDAPCAGHHGVKATYETLKQVAYWPGM